MKGSHLVRQARRRADISQAELALRTGTTQSAIARVEQGRTAPSLERLVGLIRACGFELDLRLIPYDDHDWTLAIENVRLSPEARVGKLLTTIAAVEDARGRVDG